MIFQETEDHSMIRETAKSFAQKEILPHAAEWDEQARFPQEALKKMSELGFMGMMVPPEFGGSGFDIFSYLIALEEICVACPSTGGTMSVHNSLFCGVLNRFGSEELKKKYLPSFASGEKLGAYCLSEPGTGSDAANQQTTAKREGDFYILNGTKNFITSGPHAHGLLIFAMTDKAKRHKGISLFLVEKNFPGFGVGKIEKKMGLKASSTSSIILDNCRVPAKNRIGEEGEGFSIAMKGLDDGRLGIATQALAISRAAFEAALRYIKEREAFGKKISEFQAIQWMLADSATRIDASRLLIMKAAALRSQGKPYTKEAAQAKLYASETSNFVTNKALQMHGGYGYCQDYPAERHLRDARVTEIYEGTSEIQRLVIAREILK